MQAKFVYEEIRFQRNLSPLDSLNIGIWRNGYIIEKEPKFKDLNQRVDFLINWDDYNWARKASEINDLEKTQINSDIKKDLEKLPIVKFKYYYNQGKFLGLFGDWTEDFSFRKIPFIAKVEKEKNRIFLIAPEGFIYPRYITELK